MPLQTGMITIGVESTAAPTTPVIQTLNDVVLRVAKLLRRSDSDNDEIAMWVNFAQRELCDLVGFQELREVFQLDAVYNDPTASGYTGFLVNGTFRYPLPDDFDREDRVFYRNMNANPTWGRVVDPLPRKFYGEIYERLVDISVPVTANLARYYFIENTDLILYPVPNESGDIAFLHYYKRPTDMLSPDDTPSIHNRYIHYLIWLAYYWGMVHLEKDDVNKIVLWQKKFDNVVGQVKKLALRRENVNLRFLSPPTGTEMASRIY